MKEKNMAVEGLRGVLILCIVLYHYTFRSTHYLPNPIFENGFAAGKQIGVFGFFVLSGYFLMLSLNNTNLVSKEMLLNFIYKKINRLYWPFFVACIFIGITTFIIPYLQKITFSDFFSNLFLLRCFFKVNCLDGAHWYFYSMVQLSIIVPLLYYSYKNKNVILGICSLFIIAYWFVTHSFVVNKVFLFSFIIGCLLTINRKEGLMLYFIGGLVDVYLLRQPLVLVPLILIPFVLFYQKQIVPYFSFLIENSIFIYIGKYSYMWYLIHQQFGYSLLNQFSTIVINPTIVLLVVIIITFCISVMLQRVLDIVLGKIK